MLASVDGAIGPADQAATDDIQLVAAPGPVTLRADRALRQAIEREL